MKNLTVAALLLALVTPFGFIGGLYIYNGTYTIGFLILGIVTVMEYFGFRKLVCATSDEVEKDLEEEFDERNIGLKSN